MSEQARGRFITLEGGEGVGKSVQAKRLEERLAALGLAVVRTREPGGSPGAEALREAILSGFAADFSPAGQALLFAAARVDHLDKTILPALARGAWVVSDRFADSTRAYQGAAGNLPPDFIASLERLTVGANRPDLTLILDLDPEVGLKRAAERRQSGACRPVRIGGAARFIKPFGGRSSTSPPPSLVRCAVIDAGAKRRRGRRRHLVGGRERGSIRRARSRRTRMSQPRMKKAETDDLPEADALAGAPHPRHVYSLIGHERAEAEMLSAYREGRLAHAWLIGGREGIGKATLAWRFARFVLANPDPAAKAVREARNLHVEPTHPAARLLAGLAHPDFSLIRREWQGATEEARERDFGRSRAAGTAGLPAFRRLRRLADRDRRRGRRPESQQRQRVAQNG